MKLDISHCSMEIRWVVEEVKDILHIDLTVGGRMLIAKSCEERGFEINSSKETLKIQYQRIPDFCRALLTACARNDADYMVREASSFQEFGVMLDFSRNAVMRLSKIKQYIRLLALMGYDFLGFYMEDTLKVEEEPYFGYMRGAVTKEELKAADEYAMLFGVEIRAYIQTLAHLNQITRYEDYREIIDTQDILLVGEEKTYQLLENIIRTVSEALSSRKINIGMDEAHMVGLGQYLDKHGFTDRFDIMDGHLKRVLEICKRHGLKAQMWSDMFFRLAYAGEYYIDDDAPFKLPDIPEDVELVYWDYYSCKEEHYNGMLKKHLKLTDKIGFASGAWKWMGFAPYNSYSMEIGRTSIKACRDNGIKSVTITAWGDNGGEASHFSILPALYADAEYNYREEPEKEKFKILTGIDFDKFMLIDTANPSPEDKTVHNNASKYLLYNDALLGTFDSLVTKGLSNYYEKAEEQLRECCMSADYGYLFATQKKLCRVLKDKAELGIQIKEAYDRKDSQLLREIASEKIPVIQAELEDFYHALEVQWETENKPFGFEVQCIRLGGLQKRLDYVKKRLAEYTSGRVDSLEELEADRKPFGYYKEEDIKQVNYNFWHHIVTPSVME
ncbi:beta-N-acetylhexosaminidase [Anaerocolumna xylanovorans]|uniref:Glycosyl hydrolase family 20, catalytic domain n=1 Tax=Anaerocolumna xylanovorans DSM 12503 TaxID=1121345 RepID=A0A1M7XWA5_9FIRM|nr:beta-N-acetylhexosaminidase [Anaerocolumna xylanovorans]SHO43042.1 Glycosyl hydrolase family 20, catalytic domain [Anaerocolumna xylanovorans DSM 12503]